VAGRRKVDDCEAAVTKADLCIGIDPHALVIRTAVGECSRHSADDLRLYPDASAEDAGYSAHGSLTCDAPLLLIGSTIAAFRLMPSIRRHVVGARLPQEAAGRAFE
jgi:hypothetical protein